MKAYSRSTASPQRSPLNKSWIQAAMADVASNASTIVVVETGDRMRLEQMQEFLVTVFADNLYRFHPWTGLDKRNPNGVGFSTIATKVSPDSKASAYDPTLPAVSRPEITIEDALRSMDKVLRETKAAFLIHGVDGDGDQVRKEPSLIHALRSWAYNKDIMMQQSLICLFTASAAQTLDPATLEATILARPELANEAERLSLVQAFVSQCQGSMPPEQQRVYAGSLRGLNLHQINVILRKSHFIRNEVSREVIKEFKAEHIRRSDLVEIAEPEVR